MKRPTEQGNNADHGSASEALNLGINRFFLEVRIPELEAENARLDVANRDLLIALHLAAVRLKILTGRMRACHEETGKHELLEEADMFCNSARASLAQHGDAS